MRGAGFDTMDKNTDFLYLVKICVICGEYFRGESADFTDSCKSRAACFFTRKGFSNLLYRMTTSAILSGANVENEREEPSEQDEDKLFLIIIFKGCYEIT